MKMKRVLALMLSSAMICATVPAEVLAAEEISVDADENAAQLLLDQDEIHVEYRGIAEYSSESWIINLYVENNTQNDFYFSIRNVVVNGCVISVANNGSTIQAGSNWLAEPGFKLVLDTDKLAAYDISQITDINFDIDISTEMFGDEILTQSVRINNVNKDYLGELKNKQKGTVLLDSDDAYVEYYGISEYSSQSWIVDLYVENRRDTEICLALADTLIDNNDIGLANNYVTIPAHAKYMTEPNFQMVLDTDDLNTYGISAINKISGNLKLQTSFGGDVISETKVELDNK